MADPPWHYEGFAGSVGYGGHFAGEWEQAKVQVKPLPYPSLTLGEIGGLPIARLAEDDHYFEFGRRYTYSIRQWSPRGEGPCWEVQVKQAECPWFIVCQHRFRTPWGARKFAKDYMRDGGPPRWYEQRYFEPKPPDPHEILWGWVTPSKEET